MAELGDALNKALIAQQGSEKDKLAPPFALRSSDPRVQAGAAHIIGSGGAVLGFHIPTLEGTTNPVVVIRGTGKDLTVRNSRPFILRSHSFPSSLDVEYQGQKPDGSTVTGQATVTIPKEALEARLDKLVPGRAETREHERQRDQDIEEQKRPYQPLPPYRSGTTQEPGEAGKLDQACAGARLPGAEPALALTCSRMHNPAAKPVTAADAQRAGIEQFCAAPKGAEAEAFCAEAMSPLDATKYAPAHKTMAQTLAEIKAKGGRTISLDTNNVVNLAHSARGENRLLIDTSKMPEKFRPKGDSVPVTLHYERGPGHVVADIKGSVLDVPLKNDQGGLRGFKILGAPAMPIIEGSYKGVDQFMFGGGEKHLSPQQQAVKDVEKGVNKGIRWMFGN